MLSFHVYFSPVSYHQTELEEIQDQQEELLSCTMNLKYRMKLMRQQNERIESMLKTIIKSQNVEWNEDENEEGVNE